MEDAPKRPAAGRSARFRRRRSALVILILAVTALALYTDIQTALHLYEAPPEGDAKIYSRIAVNLLDHGVFSTEEEPSADRQFSPSIIRLPGYPLFLTAVYSAAGNENYAAVRGVQGGLHFVSAIFAALLAFNWVGGPRRRKRKAAFWTFVLTAFCPFTFNYSAVLLTEILTIFLLMAMMLTATYAIKSVQRGRSVIWWALTGLLAGAAVEVRPDAGLFALGLGLTLVTASFTRLGFTNGFRSALEKGIVFSLLFILVLTPWTIRNERVFGRFQPLAPQHAEMPGEFVPVGYYAWLRTWIDDPRYISPMLWELEIHRIDPAKIPASAYTNDEERAEVAALFDQYNNSDPDHPMNPKQETADSEEANDNSDSEDSADSDDSGDDQDSDDDQEQPDQELNLKISPESDASFAEIARRRIADNPLKYYLELPAIRSTKMWFDAHADFYSFSGELFPLKDLDPEINQHLWLPFFFGIVWLYTLLAFAGLILIWLSGWPLSRTWVAMTLLVSLPRVGYFGTLENPEPRYLIELFFIAAVLCGIALSRISITVSRGQFGLTFNYGRDRARKSRD
jgi:hypothetical protein